MTGPSMWPKFTGLGTNLTGGVMTTLWDLYTEAKKEVQAEMEALVNERYIVKLERRIEELEEDLANATTAAEELPF